MTEQTAWIIWCCCAGIGIAAAVYCVFEYIREYRRAKRARAKLDADWQRFFAYVDRLGGPGDSLKYRLRAAKWGQ